MNDDDVIDGPDAAGKEEADSLGMLTMMAGQESNPAQAIADQQQAQADAALMSMEQENEQALMLVAELATPIFGNFGFPTVARVLGDPNEGSGLTNAQTLAKAWAPVLSKYGVSLGDLGGRYKAEIGAVIVTFPIAGALWTAIKKDSVPTIKPVPKAEDHAAPDEHEPELREYS